MRRLILSALLAAAVIGALHLPGPGFIPQPGGVLCVTVIACAYRGGVAGGMGGAALTLLYGAWRLSEPGRILSYRQDNLELLLLWVICLPLCAFLTGILSVRSRRLVGEREVSERETAEMRTLLDELRAAQREVMEREWRYHFLADTIPHMVWTAKPDGVPDYFNRRWLDFTGQTLEEMARGGLLKVMHPDDIPARMEVWRRAVSSGEPYEVEYRLRRAGGGPGREWRWHLSRAEPLKDEQGNVVQWLGTCTDIHDQRKARENLECRVRERTLKLEEANQSLHGEISARRTAQEAINRILTHSRDVICTVGRDGRIVQISRACREVLGYEPDELEGRSVSGLIHPEDREAAADRAGEIAGGSAHGDFPERWMRKDGGIIFIMWSASWSEEDQLMFCIGRDVTSMRAAEEEVHRARLAAEEANQAKSEFLATMSHEIRTPMNGVLGMTGLLLDTELSRRQRDFVETIRQSGELLLTLINDILDFSRIEAGKLVFEMLDFDLQEAVDGTLELMAEAARARGIQLLGEVRPDTPVHLVGDEGRLRQVLTNLVGNAIKFTGRGGEVHLEVAHRETADGRALLFFEVRDTGIGIDREARARLFQPFSQADASTTRKYGGTGLGLAICHRLVRLMDGEIGVESEPGKGSVFHFTACFGLRSTRQTAFSGQPAEHISAGASLSGLRVLAADGSAFSLATIRRRLESWGMECVTTDRGGEALELLRAAADSGNPFDAAVIDPGMPCGNDSGLLRSVRADPALAGVRLLVLGPADSAEGGSQRDEPSADAYLPRPFRLSRLHDALSAVTAERDGAAGGTGTAAVPDSPSSGGDPADPPPPMGARILLAEDNSVNQRVALLQLGKLGWQADAVANGQEAVEAILRIPYDIVLMDCQMPEMDGYAAARRIRELEAEGRTGGPDSAPVHIIALTANAMTGDRERCLAAGMNDYLTKPVRVSDLREVLARWEQSVREGQGRKLLDPDPTNQEGSGETG